MNGGILNKTWPSKLTGDEGDIDMSSLKICGVKGSVSVLTWCREFD
jgi:hypothetical protein